MCARACLCACAYHSVKADVKVSRWHQSLELKLSIVESGPLWILGNELRSSTRAAHTFSHRSIALGLLCLLFNYLALAVIFRFLYFCVKILRVFSSCAHTQLLYFMMEVSRSHPILTKSSCSDVQSYISRQIVKLHEFLFYYEYSTYIVLVTLSQCYDFYILLDY